MQPRRLRLGDVVDDYCPRERRLSNHVIVAMIDDTIKQTRCATCDFEHPFKDGKVPARRAQEGPDRGPRQAGARRIARCPGPRRWSRKRRPEPRGRAPQRRQRSRPSPSPHASRRAGRPPGTRPRVPPERPRRAPDDERRDDEPRRGSGASHADSCHAATSRRRSPHPPHSDLHRARGRRRETRQVPALPPAGRPRQHVRSAS